MARGISTTQNVSEIVACLKAQGLAFVFRYYSETTRMAEKRITLAEAEAITAAGLKICMVYQDRGNQIADFSAGEGTRDALFALRSASNLQQPAGSAIYFAVDFDATSAQVRGAITAYFTAVRAAFDGNGFLIGVYGSGLTCRELKQAGLVDFTWLSESTGFRGSSTFTTFEVKQSISTRTLCDLSRSEYEDCVTTNAAGFGEFALGHVTVNAAGTVTITSVQNAATAVSSLIDQAEVDLGVSEVPPGSNRGPRVNAMLRNVDEAPGAKWCAAAVSTWGKEAFGRAWPLPLTSSCDTLLDFARRHRVLRTTPERGDIFLVLASASDATHTGIVTQVNGQSIDTVEGNSTTNDVARRTRSDTDSLKYVRWVDLMDDFNDSTGWTLQVGKNANLVATLVIEGSAYAPMRDVMQRFFPVSRVRQSLTFKDSSLYWDEVPIPVNVRMIENKAWCPIRQIAAWQLLNVDVKVKAVRIFR